MTLISGVLTKNKDDKLIASEVPNSFNYWFTYPAGLYFIKRLSKMVWYTSKSGKYGA